jgi:hypothetical protein
MSARIAFALAGAALILALPPPSRAQFTMGPWHAPTSAGSCVGQLLFTATTCSALIVPGVMQ